MERIVIMTKENFRQTALVIMPSKNYWDYIPTIESLAGNLALDFCVLAKKADISAPATSSQISLFYETEELPGHFLNLEAKMESVCAVFILDVFSVASFQGSRLASKYDVPLFCLFSEVRKSEPDSRSLDIAAYKFDILRTVERFFCFSGLSHKVLTGHGVADDRISKLDYILNTKRLGSDRSEKFKAYLGLEKFDDVVMFEGALSKDSGVDQLIDAWQSFLSGCDSLKNPVLIIAGQGECYDEFREVASVKGVGSSVIFLKQNTFDFKYDLYRMIDFYIPAFRFNEEEINWPVRVLDAVLCGAYPLLVSCELYRKMLPDYDNFFVPISESELGDGIFEAIQKSSAGPILAQHVLSQSVVKKYQSDALNLELTSLISQSISSYLESKPNFQLGIEQASLLTEQGAFLDAIIVAEDFLLKKYITKHISSSFWRIKGDCFQKLDQLSQALDCYSEAIALNRGDASNYVVMGHLQIRLNIQDEAATSFCKAVSLDDSNHAGHLGLCLVSLEAGMFSEAGFYLESAVNRGAKISHTFPILNKIIHFSRDFNSSVQLLERLINIVGENKNLMSLLGRLYVNNGDQELGRRYLEKAV